MSETKDVGAPASASAVIVQSWHRSQAAGLSPEMVRQASVIKDVDLQHRMVQCARPVLRRLRDELADIPMSLALTDENAQVILRVDNDHLLSREMDSVCFAPGFDYSESAVGTNGVGTALESGMAVYVHGDQHFNQAIRRFACAGAPIKNPLTGRFEGIIDLSCFATDANHLMRQLALRAAKDVEESLRENGSRRQQATLAVMLKTCRHNTGPVYSLSCGVFTSNSSAASHNIDPVDEAFIREFAHELLAPGHADKADVTLPSGQAVVLRRQLVEAANEVAGVVIEVLHSRSVSSAPSPAVRDCAHKHVSLPGVVGSSPQWRRAMNEVLDSALSGTNVLIVGESGSGRTTLARGASTRKNPVAPIAVVECSRTDVMTEADSLLGSDASCVILRDVHTLSEEADRHISDLIAADRRSSPARWIVATATTSSAVASTRLAEQFSTTIEIPALRHHPDDILDLLKNYVARIAPLREVDFSEDALRVLRRYQWPGNVAELIDVVGSALKNRPSGRITAQHLPPQIHCATPRRSMSTMETVERDAIVSVLNEQGGNRTRAAQTLGISRSSLYRKISMYGIKI